MSFIIILFSKKSFKDLAAVVNKLQIQNEEQSVDIVLLKEQNRQQSIVIEELKANERRHQEQLNEIILKVTNSWEGENLISV